MVKEFINEDKVFKFNMNISRISRW